MSLEAETYALSSWKRFDDEISDELLRAVTSAFALIAVADGDLAGSEDDQFISLLKDKADVFAPLDLNMVDLLFRDICGAILSDPGSGRQHALQEIEVVHSNPTNAELVRAAAVIAMEADSRIVAKETNLMAEICGVLKIPVS